MPLPYEPSRAFPFMHGNGIFDYWKMTTFIYACPVAHQWKPYLLFYLHHPLLVCTIYLSSSCTLKLTLCGMEFFSWGRFKRQVTKNRKSKRREIVFKNKKISVIFQFFFVLTGVSRAHARTNPFKPGSTL